MKLHPRRLESSEETLLPLANCSKQHVKCKFAFVDNRIISHARDGDKKRQISTLFVILRKFFHRNPGYI